MGGGLRLVKNSGSARFSIASTECSENQLVRLGMDSTRSGGSEAGLAVGEVGDVVAEVVVETTGGCGRKDAKPVTDEVDDGDTDEEVEKGEMGECSEWDDELLDEGEASEPADDGLLRLTDVGRVGEFKSDNAKMDADEAEYEAGSVAVADCGPAAAAEVRGWESGSGRCRLRDLGSE